MNRKTFSLVFMAGCLNNQPGMKTDLLYHSLLKEFLTGILQAEVNIDLLTYHAYNQLTPAIEEQLGKKKADILILFIRPFPYMVLNKPVIKYDTPGNRKVRGIHPAIFSSGEYRWPGFYSKYISEGVPGSGERRPVNLLQEINLLTGVMMGLHRWSVGYVLRELDKVVSLCGRTDTRLILLGIPPAAGSPAGNLVCCSLNRFLVRKATRENLVYIDIFTKKDGRGNAILCGDGRHFSEAGHAFLAGMLSPVITGMLSES